MATPMVGWLVEAPVGVASWMVEGGTGQGTARLVPVGLVVGLGANKVEGAAEAVIVTGVALEAVAAVGVAAEAADEVGVAALGGMGVNVARRQRRGRWW